MTTKNSEAKPAKPTLDDLSLLHRYARSRDHQQKLSSREFERKHGLRFGTLKPALARLERHFGTYLITKRVHPHGRADISFPEDGAQALKSSGDAMRLSNRDRLTMAGEIVAEIGSLVAGYAALAKLVIGRSGARGSEHAMALVLGRLTIERRRLHQFLALARDPGADLEQMELPESAFEPDPLDMLDISTQDLPTTPFEEDIPDAQPVNAKGTEGSIRVGWRPPSR